MTTWRHGPGPQGAVSSAGLRALGGLERLIGLSISRNGLRPASPARWWGSEPAIVPGASGSRVDQASRQEATAERTK